MFILSSDGKTIHNSDYIERFTLHTESDAVLICAGYASGARTIGRYANEKEAQDALLSLFSAFQNEASAYELPDSVLFYAEKLIKDARTRRKGGS